MKFIDFSYGGKCYEVFEDGVVYSKEQIVVKKHSNGQIMRQTYKRRKLRPHCNDGYLFVKLGSKKTNKVFAIHRLVLEAFVGKCPKNMEGCHNDGNSLNNHITNLRWDTHLNNNRDRKLHGNYSRGVEHHFSKFSKEFLDKVKAKIITKSQALEGGMSNTHYYRVIKQV